MHRLHKHLKNRQTNSSRLLSHKQSEAMYSGV